MNIYVYVYTSIIQMILNMFMIYMGASDLFQGLVGRGEFEDQEGLGEDELQTLRRCEDAAYRA